MSIPKNPLPSPPEGEGRGRGTGDADTHPVSPLGIAPPSQEDRTRPAWFIRKKQELQAPANALLDLCDLLLGDARHRGQEDLVKDLESMRASTQSLLDKVPEVLANMEAAHNLRHHLRNLLSNIKGRCDLWQEEAADQCLEGFDDEIKKMLSLNQKLLGSIDELW